ncbi:MAG: TonB-dependent receptor [Pseudomonadota bacterium]
MRRLFVPSLAATLFATTSLPVFAQESETDQPEADEDQPEIIVRGTKLGDSIQDTEASVEVFTSERLDRERIIDVGQILTRTPNVNSRGGAAGSFSIRGIGRNGAGAGQGVTSNIYIDGAPLAANGLGRGPTTLWDTAQVEVLRGPQSSVQGRNALAGALVITTNDPTFDWEGKARLSYESFDTVQAAAAFGGPIIADQVAFRVAVDYQESDGFITNTIVNRSADRRESLLVRGKLLFEPEFLPNLSTKVIVDYSESDLGESRPIVSLNFGVTDPRFRDFDPLDYEGSGRFPNNDNQGLRIISDSTLRLTDNWDARALLTYEDSSTDRLFGDPDFINEFGGITFNQFDEEVYSAELRFEFDYDNVRGLFGGYYFQEESILNRDIQAELLPSLLSVVPAPLQPLTSLNPSDSLVSLRDGNTTETENFAFFGQLEYDFSPQWTLSLGFRYDNERFAIPDEFTQTTVLPENCVATLPAVILNPAVPDPTITTSLPCTTLVAAFQPPEVPLLADVEREFDAFLPRAALTYNITPDNAVFVSFQRGYRAGGSETFFAPNVGGIGLIRDVNVYDPEFLDTIEIGTRNEFMNGRLTFNANIFYSKYTDQQIRLPGENPADAADDVTSNAGETTLFGAELYAEFEVTPEFDIFATVGLLEAEFDDFPFAVDEDGNPLNPDLPQLANFGGNEVPGSPDISFTIGGNWSDDSGFFVNAALAYTGAYFDSEANLVGEDFRGAFEEAGLDGDFASTFTTLIDDRTDLNARIGYEGDNFSVYAFGSNLLNEEQVTNTFGLARPSQTTGELVLNTGEQVLTVNRPRTVGIGFDARF